MKVGIMQPYAFPYIGYFQLINYVDKWVIFDDTQYISKGWVNRNRILHPDIEKEWQYFSIPLKKHSLQCRLNDVVINENMSWRAEFLGKLTSYKKKAPFYKQTLNFVESCIDTEFSTLSEWLEFSIIQTCNYLDISLDHDVFSKMDVDTKNVAHPGQWALEIADSIGAKEYVNPSGGYEIFNEDEFKERGIKLSFLKPKLHSYSQRREKYIAGLSIIDVMMWNDKDAIKNMLNNYEIGSKSNLIAEHNNES